MEQCGGSEDREKMNYREILKIKLTDFEDGKYLWSKGGVNITDISGLLDTSTYVSSSPSPYRMSIILSLCYLMTGAQRYAKKKRLSIQFTEILP